MNKGERLVWLLGGGETLFDYRDYRKEFFDEMNNLRLKMDEDIFVLGNIPEDLIADIYNAGDVFVFPSIKEGWGLVVLEAMASCVPVIASKIEPLTEFMKNESNSLLEPPMDYKSFAAGIIRILDDYNLNQKLISSGKKTAEKYSWEATAESHLAIYNDLLNKSGLETSIANKGVS
jgi:glycosyltransferase involved in cell wall biosynthesis